MLPSPVAPGFFIAAALCGGAISGVSRWSAAAAAAAAMNGCRLKSHFSRWKGKLAQKTADGPIKKPRSRESKLLKGMVMLSDFRFKIVVTENFVSEVAQAVCLNAGCMAGWLAAVISESWHTIFYLMDCPRQGNHPPPNFVYYSFFLSFLLFFSSLPFPAPTQPVVSPIC